MFSYSVPNNFVSNYGTCTNVDGFDVWGCRWIPFVKIYENRRRHNTSSTSKNLTDRRFSVFAVTRRRLCLSVVPLYHTQRVTPAVTSLIQVRVEHDEKKMKTLNIYTIISLTHIRSSSPNWVTHTLFSTTFSIISQRKKVPSLYECVRMYLW